MKPKSPIAFIESPNYSSRGPISPTVAGHEANRLVQQGDDGLAVCTGYKDAKNTQFYIPHANSEPIVWLNQE